MTDHDPNRERRQYPRVKAPIRCRLAGSHTSHRAVVDISLGGLRLHTDEPQAVGESVEMELLLPDYSRLVCTARVAWLKPLPPGSVGKYDIGFQFLQVPLYFWQRLGSLLEWST